MPLQFSLLSVQIACQNNCDRIGGAQPMGTFLSTFQKRLLLILVMKSKDKKIFFENSPPIFGIFRP